MKLKRKYYLENMKMKILVGVATVVIVAIIVAILATQLSS